MPHFIFNIIVVGVTLFTVTRSECTYHGIGMEYCLEESGKFLTEQNALEIFSLYIYDSDLTQLTEKDFSPFQYLETLQIDNCTFPKTKGCTFLEPLKNLRRHAITNSKTSGQFVFAKKTELRYLSLQSNNISRLSSELFTQLKQVESIDLSHNNISIIAPDTFSNLTSLKRVNLANNSIGEGFDPLFLSISPSACSVCSVVRKERCLEGCRGNTEVDALWRSLEGLEVEVRLDSNPVCRRVVNGSVRLFGRRDEVVPELEAEWDGTCQVLRPGGCPAHEKRNAFLMKACFPEKEDPITDLEEPPSTSTVPKQQANAKMTDLKDQMAIPWKVWLMSGLTFVVGVLITSIAFVLIFSQRMKAEHPGGRAKGKPDHLYEELS